MRKTWKGKGNGNVFDPRAVRHFSLLPDEDAEEAYCVRHGREMQSIEPVVHTQGALYTTNDGFSVYSCPECRNHLTRNGAGEGVEDLGVKAYRSALMQAFDKWDEGEAPGDWFKYIGEGTLEDREDDGSFVAFGASGGGGE